MPKPGFKMLPVVDPDGHRTGAAGGEPYAGFVADQPCARFCFKLTGPIYLAGALMLGIGVFVVCAFSSRGI